MTRYQGHETVDPGLYFEPHGLAFRSIERREPLPGDASVRWYRVPTVALVFAGPLLGLVYVVFLPLIGFAMAFSLVCEKLRRPAARGAAAIGRAARALFGWRTPASAAPTRSRQAPPRGLAARRPRESGPPARRNDDGRRRAA